MKASAGHSIEDSEVITQGTTEGLWLVEDVEEKGIAENANDYRAYQ